MDSDTQRRVRAFHSADDYQKQSSKYVCVFELVQMVQYENEATPGQDTLYDIK